MSSLVWRQAGGPVPPAIDDLRGQVIITSSNNIPPVTSSGKETTQTTGTEQQAATMLKEGSLSCSGGSTSAFRVVTPKDRDKTDGKSS